MHTLRWIAAWLRRGAKRVRDTWLTFAEGESRVDVVDSRHDEEVGESDAVEALLHLLTQLLGVVALQQQDHTTLDYNYYHSHTQNITQKQDHTQ